MAVMCGSSQQLLLGKLLLLFLLLVCGEVPRSWAFQQQQQQQVRQHTSTTIATTTTKLQATSRRNFLATAITTPVVWLSNPPLAKAELVQFPCESLKNKYHFLRAGTSELEEDGIYSTNPLFLTNRENQMTPGGIKSLQEACQALKKTPNFPTVAYHSLAANGMDTGDFLARELRIPRDRLLPEFTYLDQRGIGLWDSTSLDVTYPAIVALDDLEAGPRGTLGRPPAKDDGTPNETLADQFIRLRQFLSLQESRTSGENILIIFPDGTGPALLSAMIAGIPLNKVHCLDYAPGEVRLDITRESVLELYAQKRNDPAYQTLLEDGKIKLAALREQSEDTVNLKDQLREEERAALDQDFMLKKQQAAEADALKVREKEAARQRQLEQDKQRKEEARLLQIQKEQQRKENIRRMQLEREATTAAKQSEQQQQQATILQATTTTTTTNQPSKNTANIPAMENNQAMDPGAILGVLGVSVMGLGGAAVAGGGDDDKKKQETIFMAANGTATLSPHPGSSRIVNGSTTSVMEMPLLSSTTVTSRPRRPTARPNVDHGPAPKTEPNVPLEEKPSLSLYQDTPEVSKKPDDNNDNAINNKEKQGINLEDAQATLFGTLDDDDDESISLLSPPAPPQQQGNESDDPVVQKTEMDRLEAAQDAMNSYLDYDDGANDWLQVLAEIREEDDDDDEAKPINGERL